MPMTTDEILAMEGIWSDRPAEECTPSQVDVYDNAGS
jgi:hypothetical protein